MKSSFMWVLLAVLLFQLPKAKSDEPFTLAISAAAPTSNIGQAVVVIVRLTNSSKRDLDASGNWSDLTGVDPNWSFEVRDSSGKRVATRIYEHRELASGKAIFRTVPPRDSIVDQVDLNRLYQFRKPGKYRVTVSRKLPKELGGIVVKSNALTLTISATSQK